MNNFNFVGILITICLPVLIFSEQDSADTSISAESATAIIPRQSLLTIGASAIIPGAGQLYTKQYLKGGTFIAIEAIIASNAIFWHKTAEYRCNEYHNILDMVSIDDSGEVRAEKFEIAHDKKYQTLTAEFKKYNALTLMTGFYIYNVLDAFEATGLFKDTEKRNPRVALGLSAIPALGLGQIYNGAYSKAGFFLMTQVSLGVLAWNYHRLVQHAESNILRINDTTITLREIRTKYSKDWEWKRRTAITSRNMYLWYSIFTYVIGIMDAVVDAHLHDYQEKMKIEPDLVPHDLGIGLNLNVNF